MVVPGLLLGLTRPFDPTLSDADFNDWYSRKHMVDVVNCGLASIAIRYKNKSASAQWPYLAIYRLADLPLLYDPVFMATVPRDSPKDWDQGYLPDMAHAELKGYSHLETVHTAGAKAGSAPVLVLIESQPAEGSAQDFLELDWKQQFSTLKEISGYRRSMVYQAAQAVQAFAPSTTKGDDDTRAGTDFHTTSEGATKYLTVHEFDTAPDAAKLKDLRGSIEVWDYISEYGTGLYRIEPKREDVYLI